MSRSEIPTLLLGATQVAKRRNVRVGELLTDERLQWVVLLTHGYCDGGIREVFGFKDLGIGDPHAGALQLSQILNSGGLLEGDRRFPVSARNVLFAHAGGEVWVRSGDKPVLVTPDLFSQMMLNHESEFDFEASGKSGEWYLRFRSDDAVIFSAATRDVVSELSALLPDRLLPVDSSFVFAR